MPIIDYPYPNLTDKTCSHRWAGINPGKSAFKAIEAGHCLQIDFDDGKQETIDFSPILKGPLFGPLSDRDLFMQVQIDPVAGTLVWPNGADFDPDTLYNWDRVVPELEARLGHSSPS